MARACIMTRACSADSVGSMVATTRLMTSRTSMTVSSPQRLQPQSTPCRLLVGGADLRDIRCKSLFRWPSASLDRNLLGLRFGGLGNGDRENTVPEARADLVGIDSFRKREATGKASVRTLVAEIRFALLFFLLLSLAGNGKTIAGQVDRDVVLLDARHVCLERIGVLRLLHFEGGVELRQAFRCGDGCDFAEWIPSYQVAKHAERIPARRVFGR